MRRVLRPHVHALDHHVLAFRSAEGRLVPEEVRGCAVGDEILTPEEEEHVQELVRILGVDLGAFLQQDPELGRHVMVAEANGGFLPEVPSSRLVTEERRDRAPRGQGDAPQGRHRSSVAGRLQRLQLPDRQDRLRYRVGGYRGQSVEVGTKRVPADDGILVLSSQRAVFIGNQKTIELPYAKLVNLTVFSDGVQFHVSNRQTAPVFVVPASDVVAAFVHTAAQRLNADA